MTGFLARLKQRKLGQWALAYVAFALLQGVDPAFPLREGSLPAIR